jgi:hypothetical protein
MKNGMWLLFKPKSNKPDTEEKLKLDEISK